VIISSIDIIAEGYMAPRKIPELSRVEMAVLAALVGKERYGLEIRNALQDAGQPVSLAGLYTLLPRLENQGLVTSRWGDEEVEARQGAKRRYYAITALGARAIKEATAVMTRVLRPVRGLAYGEVLA
jgi:PadR family transcriptional regulator, regulatory protein PadR